MPNYVDIVCGLAWGDEGKGKVVSELCKKSKYTHVCRWNGGPNAGHTVYVEGKKHKTHQIPSGVFHGITSIIGPNCVVDFFKLQKEIRYLENAGFNPLKCLKIHPHTSFITPENIRYDEIYLQKDLGTTGCGIAPCYADKALRKSALAKNFLKAVEMQDLIWDCDWNSSAKVLCEGAQGIWLDINQGNPPYTTSSETLPYSACSLGFSFREIGDVIGVAKMYDTRSGNDPAFPEEFLTCPERGMIGATGNEFGTTTGRARKVNFLNLDKLIKAIDISGTMTLVINKGDVLEKCGIFKLYYNNKLIEFKSLEEMQDYIRGTLDNCTWIGDNVWFSDSPETIPEGMAWHEG
jgi:adenylosuccinate synthase